LEEYDEFNIRFEDEDLKLDCTITCLYQNHDIYERVFKTVGFENFRWVPLILSDDAENKDFFQEFMENPTITAFEAFKP
jgi:hypothetical protein